MASQLLATCFEPFAWYRDMRTAAPVARDARTGSVGVFRFGDIKRVLR